MQRKRKSISTSEAVNSKIEITKAKTGFVAYRATIADMSEKMKNEVLKICGGNLLSAKMALWSAAEKIEQMMKERREGGD